MMKRSTWMIVLIVLFSLCLFGAKLTFWTAPNPQQEAFWKQIVAQWNALHSDIQIDWKTIPASGSSEEAILTSIASGQGPDLCTNIFSGFAAQLIEAEILVPLDTLEGFESLVEQRKMGEALKGWETNGHSYVLPIYSNPMLFWWREDILKDAGFDTPPRTYGEILALAEKICIPKERYVIQFIKGRNWWDRWFDFITFYYAASDGKPYVDINRGRALFNDEYGKELSSFVYTLFENGWTAVDLLDNPLYTGAIVGSLEGPWNMPWAQNLFPDVYPEKIVFSAPPVPDSYPEDQPVKTFADTKGLVLFNYSKYQKEAWQFVQWVFSNAENDRLWLEMTNLPPVRSDLVTNPLFADIMQANPALAEYAKYVPLAVPPVLSPRFVEIQDTMSQYLTEPLSLLKGKPEDILSNAAKMVNRELF